MESQFDALTTMLPRHHVHCAATLLREEYNKTNEAFVSFLFFQQNPSERVPGKVDLPQSPLQKITHLSLLSTLTGSPLTTAIMTQIWSTKNHARSMIPQVINKTPTAHGS